MNNNNNYNNNNNINYSLKDELLIDKYMFATSEQKKLMKINLLRDFANLATYYPIDISKNYSIHDNYYDIKREYVYYKKYISKNINNLNITIPKYNTNNDIYIIASDKEKIIIKYKLLRDLLELSTKYNITLSKNYTINDNYYDIKLEYIKIKFIKNINK